MEREIWRPHLLARLAGLIAGLGTAILAGSTIISPADGLSIGWRIAGPAFASALSLVFFRSATSLRVELQDDGVHVVNPFTRRYAGWTDIRAAHATDTGVVVTRTDGTVIVAWALKTGADRPMAQPRQSSGTARQPNPDPRRSGPPKSLAGRR